MGNREKRLLAGAGVSAFFAAVLTLASSTAAGTVPEGGKSLPRLGMNTHLHKWELVDRHLDMIQNLGAEKIRYTLNWKLAEEGGMRVDHDKTLYTHIDNFSDFTRRARQRGMEMVAVVHGMPNLPGDILDDIENWERTNRRFAEFLGRAAELLPEVRYWQIWNEPDAGHWGRVWDSYPYDRELQGRRYAGLLKLAYPAIKKANPEAVVITAGLTGNEKFDGKGLPDYTRREWTFLKALYEEGGGDFFDILALHSYYPRGESEGFREALEKAGDPERELWLTEFGYPGDDDAGQLEHWKEVLETPQPYSHVFGYTLFEHTNLSILKSDAVTTRPVYDWLEERASGL